MNYDTATGLAIIRKRSAQTTQRLFALRAAQQDAMDASEKRGVRPFAKDAQSLHAAADGGRPIASLKNSGNTCYLNSILYILRFTSRFLHNLHHLSDESAKIASAQDFREVRDTKAKSSSLGRNVAASYGSHNSRSSSTKDLLSVGMNDAPRNNKVALLTEKLHEVFATLHNMEHGSKRSVYDAYLPEPLLQALRDTNSIYCNNEPQDAHELLLYLLDNIRDTCNYIDEHTTKFPTYENATNSTSTNSSGNIKLWTRLTSKRKKPAANKEKDKDREKEEALCVDGQAEPNPMYSDSDTEDVSSSSSTQTNCTNKEGYFLVEDFKGQTVRSTKCIQCENVTQRKEQFFEIAVPIRKLTPSDMQRNPSELYREACLAPETLRGADKYFCNDCRTLCEAVRSVAFERLPKVMILQQKRFMHTGDGFEKVNTYMPTPLRLDCFCEACVEAPAHAYKLSGVVMHVGSTMQSGHYKSYVAASERHVDYSRCASARAKTASDKSEKTLYFFAAMKRRDKSATNNNDTCASRNCCSVKLNLNLSALDLNADDEVWLECNDERVRPISIDELEDELAYKTENTNTPYLLFYEKVDH